MDGNRISLIAPAIDGNRPERVTLTSIDMDAIVAAAVQAAVAAVTAEQAPATAPAAKVKRTAKGKTATAPAPAVGTRPAGLENLPTVGQSLVTDRKTGEQRTRYAGTWRFKIEGTLQHGGNEYPMDATFAGSLIGWIKGDPDTEYRTFETLTERQIGALVAYVTECGGSVAVTYAGDTAAVSVIL